MDISSVCTAVVSILSAVLGMPVLVLINRSEAFRVLKCCVQGMHRF
jgi:hypothetical protein